MEKIAIVADRFQVPDRTAAAIANAALEDAGLITPEDSSYVIDKNKLRREREKYRMEIRENERTHFEIVNGIYLDGKKDDTLTLMVGDNGKQYQSSIREEHYVLVGEPGGVYLTHTTPENGTARCIAESVFHQIENTDLQDKLAIVGTDGTNTMVGCNNGFIRQLEGLLGRPLQWCICLLHLNELPLRRVFRELDGSTSVLIS